MSQRSVTTTERISYNLTEAAEQIGMSYASLRRRIAAGEIPVARVGSMVIVTRADLERFLE